MRRFSYLVFVALQLIGCGQIPALIQSNSSESHYSRVRNHIVQSGGGAQTVTITPPVPNGNSLGITQGPGGKMWFTQIGFAGSLNLVGSIDMSGTVTEYFLGNIDYPGLITAGSDGGLWFSDGYLIGRISTSGVITRYTIPGSVPYAGGITTGSDGNVWFSVERNRAIDKISPHGVITEYKIPLGIGGDRIGGITNGPDGNVWFTGSSKGTVGVVSPSGHFRYFKIPTPYCWPFSIASGGDGNLYFTENQASQIGEISRNGKITEYPLPLSDTYPTIITKGYSGSSMWFVDYDRATYITQVRQFITSSKTFTPPIVAPYSPSSLFDLHAGPDGNMWITDTTPELGNILVVLTHVLTTIPSSVQLPYIENSQTVQIYETQNKGGAYTAMSSDQSIATVTHVDESDSFVVTAQGVGTCSIRVRDGIGNYVDVPVTVQ